MFFTAWTNGSSGYGFKITKTDRDACFDREWTEVLIELPAETTPQIAKCNIDKTSFWNDTCRELIKNWLIKKGFAPWEKGNPPKFEAWKLNGNHFRVSGSPVQPKPQKIHIIE